MAQFTFVDPTRAIVRDRLGPKKPTEMGWKLLTSSKSQTIRQNYFPGKKIKMLPITFTFIFIIKHYAYKLPDIYDGKPKNESFIFRIKSHNTW